MATSPSAAGEPTPRSGWLRRWGLLLVLLVVLVIGSVIFVFFTGNPFGIEIWVVAIVLVAVWNLRVAWRAWRTWRSSPAPRGRSRRELTALLGATSTAILWGPLFPLLYTPAAGLFALGALFAFLWSVLRFRAHRPADGPRSRLSVFLPFYNLFIFLVTLAWFFAIVAAFPTGGAGTLFYGLARADGLFQEIEVSFLAGFAAIFVLPPVLPEPPRLGEVSPSLTPAPDPAISGRLRGLSKRPLRVTLLRGLRLGVAFAVIFSSAFMLAVTPISFYEVASFDGLPDVSGSSYALEPGFHFAIVLASLTDTTSPPSGFPGILSEEISLAKSLGVDYVRFDLQEELLHNPQGAQDLGMAVRAIRNASLGVILSPFGDQSWSSQHPTVSQLNATISNESLYLASTYHPDYLFPFYEPNGQVQVNLGHTLPTSEWLGMIAATAAQVKAVSPSTKVLIEIADNSQGVPLAQGLMNEPNVDAVGFDLYPGGASDLSKVDAYAAVVEGHPSKSFWISEMGLETTTYGAEAQAHFIATMVSRATEKWNASGLCVWGLEDNVGLGLSPLHLDSLGIVTQNDQPKPGFYAYQAAIAKVHGT